MILIDAGPLVAMHDDEDSYHHPCTEILTSMGDQAFGTTWACSAEAMYLLGKAGGFHFQSRLWHSWNSGLLTILDLSNAEVERAAALMEKYQDHPMDLADATLVAMADLRRWHKVFTLDTHFFAYRLSGGAPLDVVLPM